VPTPHTRHIKAWSKSTRQQGIHSSTHATWPNRDRSIKLSATGINLLQVSRHLYLTVLVVLIIIHIWCRFGRFHSVYACISLGSHRTKWPWRKGPAALPSLDGLQVEPNDVPFFPFRKGFPIFSSLDLDQIAVC
jgi:hypothetical protein